MNSRKSSSKSSSHHKASSSSAAAVGGSSSGHRKSRWESADDRPPSDRRNPPDPKPSKPKDDPAAAAAAGGGPSVASPAAAAPPVSGALRHPPSFSEPPPPPPYGFHNLERRTIVLADGSVRSYFALPPDYSPDTATGPYGSRPGPEPGHGLGFDRHFAPPPPPGGGRHFSPDNFREPPPYGSRAGPRDFQHDYWASLGLDGPWGLPSEGGPSSLKRKYGEEDELAWRRQHVMQFGNPNADRGDFSGRGDRYDDMRLSKQAKLGGEGYEDYDARRGRREDDVPPVAADVDPQALKSAFLKFAKAINENSVQKKNYVEDGRSGNLQCIVCGRASKDFSDVHGLIMHAYSSQNADLRVDHLGLHKALCVLMGWNYARAPENSKAYQLLSADEAQANRDDLILWPPSVIIHNTNSGRRKDGRMEGMGNKEMDTKLKELGFGGGKSKSMYGKEGHLGITVVKFANTQVGLKEAERLADYFEKDNHGRKGWARAQASQTGDDDKHPALVKVDEKTGEKKRILYGYLATASDLDKLDYDMKKKASIKSRREFDPSD